MEMVVVLPLLLLILGGVVDLSSSLADREVVVEVARTAGRVASRTWPAETSRVESSARTAAEHSLSAIGYRPEQFETVARIRELILGGNRYTLGVEVTVRAREARRRSYFLPGSLAPALSGSSFYRLENARVEIRDRDRGDP